MFKYLIDYVFRATFLTKQAENNVMNVCVTFVLISALCFCVGFSLECVCQSQHKGQACSSSKKATPHPLLRRPISYWDMDDLVAWLVWCYFSGMVWRVLDSCSGRTHMCLRACCDRVSGREKERERDGTHLKEKQLQVEFVPLDYSPAKERL